MKRIVFCVATALVSHCMLGQSVVTIDKFKQYQKIDGFGTHFGKHVSWDFNLPHYDEDHLKRIIDDLGISIHRTWIDPKLEMVNDNNDPNVTDLVKFKANLDVLSTDGCRGEFIKHKDMIAYMKAYQERALRNGDTIKFYGSVMSPPHWMKYTKCYFGTDNIWNRMATFEEETAKGGTNGVDGVKDFKDEFAEWLYATMKTWKDAGIDLYAIGIQNEPSFAQPYGSCVYTPSTMPAVIAKTGDRFVKENITTKIIFPEDMGEVAINNQFVISLNNNPIAKKYGHIFGVHQYTQDGVTPGSIAANTWSSLYKIAQRGAARPVWMTETSGFGAGVPAMKKMYTSIFAALKFGNISGWNWYDATDNDSEVENISSFFVKKDGKQVFTKKGQAFRHYSKHIRPGSIMVDATCPSDAEVLTLAFQDNYRKRLTITLINNDSVNSKTVILSFKDNDSPKKFIGYRTSDKIDYLVMDSIDAISSIVLPANSITTLVGNNSKPVVTGMDTEVASQNKFEVYPNPSQEGFYFVSRIGANTNSSIEIMDMQGRLVMSLPYHQVGKEQYIESSGLINGIYTVKYNNQFQKVVINK